jgi:hypothetical protein
MRLSQFSFPLELNPVTEAFFARMAPIVGGPTGDAMSTLARDPTNANAAATLSANPSYNALMRTTCVATMLNAGQRHLSPEPGPHAALAIFVSA